MKIFFLIFLQSIHQVDMKNVVKWAKDFFSLFRGSIYQQWEDYTLLPFPTLPLICDRALLSSSTSEIGISSKLELSTRLSTMGLSMTALLMFWSGYTRTEKLCAKYMEMINNQLIRHIFSISDSLEENLWKDWINSNKRRNPIKFREPLDFTKQRRATVSGMKIWLEQIEGMYVYYK